MPAACPARAAARPRARHPPSWLPATGCAEAQRPRAGRGISLRSTMVTATKEESATNTKPTDSIFLRHKRDSYYLAISAFVVVYLLPLDEATAAFAAGPTTSPQEYALRHWKWIATIVLRNLTLCRIIYGGYQCVSYGFCYHTSNPPHQTPCSTVVPSIATTCNTPRSAGELKWWWIVLRLASNCVQHDHVRRSGQGCHRCHAWGEIQSEMAFPR